MKIAPLLVLLTLAASADDVIPRPKGLPPNVPADAVIKRHAGHGDGGLLEITWGHSAMIWAEPCRTQEAAENFEVDGKMENGCPIALDMQVRPMMRGSLDRAASRKARKARSKKPCCYKFEVLGNR